MLCKASLSYLARTATMRSGCVTPAGFRSTSFTTLKLAVLAPMPSASAATAVMVKPGLLASVRQAMRRSDGIGNGPPGLKTSANALRYAVHYRPNRPRLRMDSVVEQALRSNIGGERQIQ